MNEELEQLNVEAQELDDERRLTDRYLYYALQPKLGLLRRLSTIARAPAVT